MGKRSTGFKLAPNWFYKTPPEAIPALLPHLECHSFAEPCAGDGALVDLLEAEGFVCSWQSDIAPQRIDILEADALELTEPLSNADCIITNPVWDRTKKSDFLLHKLIEHFRVLNTTWLLFDADWMHTKQSSEMMQYCSKVVSIGRLKWIPGSKSVGKDNCCWFQFQKHKVETVFYGR